MSRFVERGKCMAKRLRNRLRSSLIKNGEGFSVRGRQRLSQVQRKIQLDLRQASSPICSAKGRKSAVKIFTKYLLLVAFSHLSVSNPKTSYLHAAVFQLSLLGSSPHSHRIQKYNLGLILLASAAWHARTKAARRSTHLRSTSRWGEQLREHALHAGRPQLGDGASGSAPGHRQSLRLEGTTRNQLVVPGREGVSVVKARSSQMSCQADPKVSDSRRITAYKSRTCFTMLGSRWPVQLWRRHGQTPSLPFPPHLTPCLPVLVYPLSRSSSYHGDGAGKPPAVIWRVVVARMQGLLPCTCSPLNAAVRAAPRKLCVRACLSKRHCKDVCQLTVPALTRDWTEAIRRPMACVELSRPPSTPMPGSWPVESLCIDRKYPYIHEALGPALQWAICTTSLLIILLAAALTTSQFRAGACVLPVRPPARAPLNPVDIN
ncbi:hypothetical protein GGX14DRAFT_399768 [Mycena pura]|uniref:Uncharacterized protein n=1 Tax=Mycena pura TaxID=153505 RepID=A0AAD6V3T3_9AGAR|nr:hypothetical protein GGX14DRAFT_399768 [Mycena pura]